MATKIIYLSGFENPFQDRNHLTNFIVSQRIIKKFANQNLVTNSKLTFEDNKLTKYEYISEGVVTHILELNPEIIGMPLPNSKEQSPSIIEFSENGWHTMGGKYPENFHEPDHNGIMPLVYVAKISNKDPMFTWLPFDLNVAFPIYAHVGAMYFDYSNPEKPIIINAHEFNAEHSNYEPHISKNSIIEFESAKFNFVHSNSIINEDGSCFGHAGMPSFSQTNPLPVNPKSGQLMPFVCQLFSGVKMKNCDIIVKEEYYKKDLQALNFWSDAWLAIYFEPDTKVMCALISH
jgi:hypothetical protein